MANVTGGIGLVALALVAGCGATNTGNPTKNDGGGGPAGIDLFRSGLERDATPDVTDAEADTFSSGGRDFAFDMFAQAVTGDENLVFSPYSIRVALGMAYAGAKGNTKQEMKNALHFDLPEPELHAAFNRTALDLASRKGQVPLSEQGGRGGDLELNVINAMFGRKGTSFSEPFLDLLATHYDTGVYAADFSGAADAEREAINAWVEEETSTRIQDLLPEGSVNSGTEFVLLNAVYFKGSWQTRFDASRTANEPFNTKAGDVQASMMNGYADDYFAGDGYAALALPYIARNLEMLLLMPDEGRFDEIEGKLSRAVFDEARAGLSRHSVQVKIPKFTIDSEVGLAGALKALGVADLFEGGVCDLSGIAGAPGDIFVTGAFHKAFIGVDEAGTEAAAATALIGGTVSAPPPAEFIADRPFFFAIHDKPTGEILFLGRVMDPS